MMQLLKPSVRCEEIVPGVYRAGSGPGNSGETSRTDPGAGRRCDLRLDPPDGFRFERAVLGHGWFDLPPFAWEADSRALVFAMRLPRAGAVAARIAAPAAPPGAGAALRLTLAANGTIGPADRLAAQRVAARVLRLDEDVEAFYRRALEVPRPDMTWVRAAGAGRLLRSPSVFEDLVKMICTTNCTWALTRVMVGELVHRLGEEAPGGLRLFPTAEAMAARPPRFFRDLVRAGYRGPYLSELARAVARGRLDPEAWLDRDRPTAQIREEILSVPGAGPYVADNMLKLLGRYDGLGIDSWCRRKFSEIYHRGRKVTDRRIERFYEPFGQWRGLALWCDITRDWFEGDDPVVAGQKKFPPAAG